MTWVWRAVAVGSSTIAALRWLRVAQREHYLPSVGRFAVRWWRSTPLDVALVTVGLAGAVVAVWWQPGILVSSIVAAGAPHRLGVRGRTGALAWTSRLRRLAGVTGVLAVVTIGVGAITDMAAVVALVPLAIPVIVDLSLLAIAPLEKALGTRWVRQASERLRASGATVVAITGSFGKTTTKGYVAHLLGDRRAVVASPASFNNRLGLARAVNEHVGPGLEVFVAEMGTYGIGEIAELCAWFPPDVAVITSVGPVHLERMKNEETVLRAKREILERARVAVMSVDHPLLAAAADEESSRRTVVRCSGSLEACDVHADPETGLVTVEGKPVGTFDPRAAQASNVACAVGAVMALGIDPHDVGDRLAGLPVPPHRRSVTTSERGFVIVDDTFNANPAGFRSALDRIARDRTPGGRAVLVTPGMVELGSRQDEENRLAMQAALEAGISDLVTVGRTNRRSLVEGARSAGLASVIVVDTRDEAVAWVRENLGPGDVVLYENDLPDHYP